MNNYKVSAASDKYIPIFGQLRTTLLFNCEVVIAESGAVGEHCCKD